MKQNISSSLISLHHYGLGGPKNQLLMTIRMDILPNLKQGNQLHLIWAFFGPSFGPNRSKYCHKGVTQKGPNGHFQRKGTQSKCSSQKNHQYVPLRQKESRITL